MCDYAVAPAETARETGQDGMMSTVPLITHVGVKINFRCVKPLRLRVYMLFQLILAHTDW